MKLVEKLIDELYQRGLSDYFVVTGGAIVPFIDAVERHEHAKYYCFQHEQAAAMAADGYYRASGKIAVVLVTSGPGVQNILNGVCGCWYDSIPALFISGQVNMKESLDAIQAKPRQIGFQETPVAEMFSSVTLLSKKVKHVSEVGPTFSHALDLLTHGRLGPVLIDFPVNVQMESISDDTVLISDDASTSNQLDTLTVSDEIVQTIQCAKRPMVLIGNGARHARLLHQWLDSTNIPSATTWGAIDLVHKNTLGTYGVYGDRVANFAIQNADVLIILGARMDTRQTGGNLTVFSRESKKIMVDIDSEEIKKLEERGIHVDFPLCGDVCHFVNRLIEKNDLTEWYETISTWKQAFGKEPRKGDVYTFLENLDLPENCMVMPDTGGNLVWTMQTIKPTKGQRVFTNLGNSSMGWSLPAAIGAAIATRGKIPIVCIIGDGGIQMNIQELATLAAFQLPVNIIVINNRGYGIIKQFQDSYFGSRYTATSSHDVFGGTDGISFTNIARAYNIPAWSEYKGVVTSGPVLYDISIDTDQKIYPKLEFGNALEHMSPLMDLEKYMIVKPIPPNIISGWKVN